MSSSYYVNALFSKYTAGASLFQNAEPTSCSFAPSSQRSGYGAGAGGFAAGVPGVYNVGGPLYQGPFAAGYGLGADAYGNLPCAPFDQGLPALCGGDLAKGACDKPDDGAAEASLRIYPWMRSSGEPGPGPGLGTGDRARSGLGAGSRGRGAGAIGARGWRLRAGGRRPLDCWRRSLSGFN